MHSKFAIDNLRSVARIISLCVPQWKWQRPLNHNGGDDSGSSSDDNDGRFCWSACKSIAIWFIGAIADNDDEGENDSGTDDDDDNDDAEDDDGNNNNNDALRQKCTRILVHANQFASSCGACSNDELVCWRCVVCRRSGGIVYCVGRFYEFVTLRWFCFRRVSFQKRGTSCNWSRSMLIDILDREYGPF